MLILQMVVVRLIEQEEKVSRELKQERALKQTSLAENEQLKKELDESTTQLQESSDAAEVQVSKQQKHSHVYITRQVSKQQKHSHVYRIFALISACAYK